MARMHREKGGFVVILGSFAAVAVLLGVGGGVPPATTSPAIAADKAGPGPTVVITGANRGLGLEFARQFHAAGARVFKLCIGYFQRMVCRADISKHRQPLRGQSKQVIDFGHIHAFTRRVTAYSEGRNTGFQGVDALLQTHHGGLGRLKHGLVIRAVKPGFSQPGLDALQF